MGTVDAGATHAGAMDPSATHAGATHTGAVDTGATHANAAHVGGNRRVVYQVTRSNMRQHLGRTVFSIIGLALMVALMTCVFVGRDTALGYLRDVAQTSNGSWHAAFYDIDVDQYRALCETPYVRETVVSANQLYSDFAQSGNPERPLLDVREYSPEMFGWMNVRVVEGRLPQGPGEAVLSVQAVRDGAELEVGSRVAVSCYRRLVQNFGDTLTVFPFLGLELPAGQTVEAPADFPVFQEDDPFLADHRELHENTGFEATYTVVGLVEADLCEREYSPFYTLIAWMDPDPAAVPQGTFNCCVLVDGDAAVGSGAGSGSIWNDLRQRTGVERIEVNDAVMAFSGSSSDNTVNEVMLMGQAFFIVLIALVSIILIHNMFSLSFDERCRFLGMLSSVGATARQRRSSVYYEAACLLLPALPLGIALGLVIVACGVGVLVPFASTLLASDFTALATEVPVRLAVTPLAIGLVVAFSVATVWVSVLMPLRRVAKIGPVEAIRGNGSDGSADAGKAGVRKAAGKKAVAEKTLAEKDPRFPHDAQGMLARGLLAHERHRSGAIVRAVAMLLIVLTVTAYGAQAINQMVQFKLVDDVTYSVGDADDHDYTLIVPKRSDVPTRQLVNELAATPGISDVRLAKAGTWVGRVDGGVYGDEYWQALYGVLSQYYPEGLSHEEFERDYVDGRTFFANMIALDDKTFDQVLAALGGTAAAGAGSGSGSAGADAGSDAVHAGPCIVIRTGEMSTDSQRIWGRSPVGFRYYEIEHMTDLSIGDIVPVTVAPGDSSRDDLVMSFWVAGLASAADLKPWLTVHSDDLWLVTSISTATRIEDVLAGTPTQNPLETYVFFDADTSQPQAASRIEQLRAMCSTEALDAIFVQKDEGSVVVNLTEIIQVMIQTLMAIFTAVCSLVCFLNTYNSVAGLMSSRRRTFAVLRSVGMTSDQVLGMCRREACGLLARGFLWAAPVSAALCVAINLLLVRRFGRFTVAFPTLYVCCAAAATVVGVLLLVRFCCSRENHTDIMAEVRKDGV